MWFFYMIVSVLCMIAVVLFSFATGRKTGGKYNIFNMLFAGTVVSAFFLFVPVHCIEMEKTVWANRRFQTAAGSVLAAS